MNEELELSKIDQQNLASFEKMKASIDEQVANLKLIKVTDETSLAVANQQLSKGKQLGKQVDSAHEKVKAPAWAVCKAADKLKRDLKAPLDDAMSVTEKEVLSYDSLKEKERQEKETERAKKQEAIERQMQEVLEAELKAICEFEASAFNAIEVSDTKEQLSEIYTKYVIGFPKHYPEEIKSRIKSLGTAKFNVLKLREFPDLKGETSKEVQGIYHEMYLRFNNIKPEAKPVIPAITTPSFEATAYIPASPNIKTDWDYQIVDIREVPLQFLIIDESAVKKYIKNNLEDIKEGYGLIVPGINFIPVKSLKIK